MSGQVTERLFAAPRETAQDVRGIALVHPVGDAECTTPWPARVCLCGYYTLAWRITPADLAAGHQESPA